MNSRRNACHKMRSLFYRCSSLCKTLGSAGWPTVPFLMVNFTSKKTRIKLRNSCSSRSEANQTGTHWGKNWDLVWNKSSAKVLTSPHMIMTKLGITLGCLLSTLSSSSSKKTSAFPSRLSAASASPQFDSLPNRKSNEDNLKRKQDFFIKPVPFAPTNLMIRSSSKI